MPYRFDSFDAKYKKPFGCLIPDQPCEIHVDETEPYEGRLFLEIRREDGFYFSLPLKYEDRRWQGRFVLSDCGLYFYRFRLLFGDNSISLGMGEDRITLIENGGEWQLSCVPSEFCTPSWCRGKVMYQIFPDRFFHSSLCDARGKLTPFRLHKTISEAPCDGSDEDGNWNNDFYGGNLKGIEEKLPYLASLGVGILYLNPIFFAYSNHRYDTANYKKIDPLLGNEADFRSLCDAAHAHGMKLILDGVFSHVGADSVYFDARKRFGSGAASDPASVYREWFDFQQYPDQYTCWWNVKSLPCVKEMTPSFVSYVITDPDSVVAHWIRLGADGFRLDVADELPDAFIRLLRLRLKELKPDALLIGEVWEDASNKISYGERRSYFTAGELDSVMNYPFRELILALIRGDIGAEAFAQGIMTILEHYPKTVIPCLMNNLSTHDTPRIAELMRDYGGSHALFAAIFLQFMLPGIPCIYYGDEIGMMGGRDPYNRGYFAWDRMDEEILDFCRTMSRLHRNFPVLADGNTRFVRDDGTLHMVRGEHLHAVLILDPEQVKHVEHPCPIHSTLHDHPTRLDFILYET